MLILSDVKVIIRFIVLYIALKYHNIIINKFIKTNTKRIDISDYVDQSH